MITDKTNPLAQGNKMNRKNICISNHERFEEMSFHQELFRDQIVISLYLEFDRQECTILRKQTNRTEVVELRCTPHEPLSVSAVRTPIDVLYQYYGT